MKFIISMAAAFAAVSVSASAQNQQLSQPTQGTVQVLMSLSADEMVGILNEVELPAKFLMEIEDGIKIVEADAGGASVYVALSECNGAGSAARCELVEPFIFFNATGFTLQHANTFNLDQSTVSVAGLDEDGDGLLASKYYLSGGVSISNFLLTLGLYFGDIDTLLKAIEPGVLARVNYEPNAASAFASTSLETKGLSFDLPNRDGFEVNSVGRNAPTFMTDSLQALIKDPSKIKQTW